MKKILVLLGASSLIFTSCKDSSIQVFSSKNVVAAEEEVSELLKNEENDINTKFVYEPLLNQNIYKEHGDGVNILITVPETKSHKVNEMIIDQAQKDISKIKKKNVDKNIDYELDYDLVNLSKDIINIKYTGKLKINDKEKRIVKTELYNLDAEREIKLSFKSEKAKNELKTMAINSKKIFKDEKVFEKLENKNYEEALDPLLKNYETFVFNEQKKELVLIFDEEQIGVVNQDNLISVAVPLRFLINTFREEATEIYDLYKHTFNDERKYVALTFDDGPHATNTDKLLSGLKELDVKATFFVLGYSIENNLQTLKRISEEGHEIGNHSLGHADLTKLDESDIIFQIQSTNRMISEITNKQVNLLRPPYGAHDERVDKIAKELGMSMVFWNVDPIDWRYKDAKSVYDNIVNVAQDGDIILLHDLYESSVDAALLLIPHLQEKGYEFITVSELVEKNSKLIAGERYYFSKSK